MNELKPNLSKYEVAGICALKQVKVAICGIKCVDLTKKAIKIFGVFFSYDKNLPLEDNFKKTLLNTERILKMWSQKTLTLEDEIIIFKTIKNYLLKINSLAQVLVVPNQIVDALEQIQKHFLWNSSFPKVRHETICKDFQYGGLKNVDIKSKIISLH